MIYTFTIQCTTLSHNVRADAIRPCGWRVPFNRVLLKPPLVWRIVSSPGGLENQHIGTENEASLASGAAAKNTIISIKIYKKSKYYKKIQEKPWDFFL